MSTLGEMVRRIRVDLNRGTAHDSRIKEAIADAIARYRSKRLGFNQKRSMTVLTSDVEFIALPSDWIEVDHLRLESGPDRAPMREVSYDSIEDKQRGTAHQGEPREFAIHNRQLRFYPKPDSSYTLVMSFHCELPGVSVSASDAASNAWMTEGEELVRKHAMSELLVTYVGGSATQLGLLLRQDVSDNVLPALETRAAREQTSGQIRAFM